MRKKQYILLGDPLPLARIKGPKQGIWNEITTQKFAFQIQVDEQHGTEPLFSRPFSLEVYFYFAPGIKSALRDKIIGMSYSSRPSLNDLVSGLLGLLDGRIYKPNCMLVSIKAHKKYDKVPRIEWVCTEVE